MSFIYSRVKERWWKILRGCEGRRASTGTWEEDKRQLHNCVKVCFEAFKAKHDIDSAPSAARPPPALRFQKWFSCPLHPPLFFSSLKHRAFVCLVCSVNWRREKTETAEADQPPPPRPLAPHRDGMHVTSKGDWKWMEQKGELQTQAEEIHPLKNLGQEYSLEPRTEFGPDNNDSWWGEEYRANITDRRMENVAAPSL